MARVTSKLQVTIPKAIARRYGIEPGADVEFLPAGDAIRVGPHAGAGSEADRGRRLDLFDRATDRERARPALPRAATRGWSREELYDRGRPR